MFNAGVYLTECVDSVLGQSFKNLEVILIDDGSTDDSLQRIKDLAVREERVRFHSQNNSGSAVARNKGIELAQGRWIAFIDADDVWHPEKLSLQLALLKAADEPLVSFTNFAFWEEVAGAGFGDADDEFAGAHSECSFPEVALNGPEYVYHVLLQDVFVWTSTVVAPRASLLDVGGFDPTLRKGQDYDLWLKLSQQLRFIRRPEVMALYRQHADNITASHNPINFAATILERAILTYGLTSPDGAAVAQPLMHARLQKMWRDHADRSASFGDFPTALHSQKRALSYGWGVRGAVRYLELLGRRVLADR